MVISRLKRALVSNAVAGGFDARRNARLRDRRRAWPRRSARRARRPHRARLRDRARRSPHAASGRLCRSRARIPPPLSSAWRPAAFRPRSTRCAAITRRSSSFSRRRLGSRVLAQLRRSGDAAFLRRRRVGGDARRGLRSGARRVPRRPARRASRVSRSDGAQRDLRRLFLLPRRRATGDAAVRPERGRPAVDPRRFLVARTVVRQDRRPRPHAGRRPRSQSQSHQHRHWGFRHFDADLPRARGRRSTLSQRRRAG